MPRFKDQAICIRHVEWSETSQIVVLMTEHHGKVRGLAKGSKRTSPSSVQRFSGGIELLTRGEILGVIRPSTELATLTEWDLQDDYHRLRRDLPAQRLALYAADVVHALSADQDAHPRTYFALRTFLETLAPAPGSVPHAGSERSEGPNQKTSDLRPPDLALRRASEPAFPSPANPTSDIQHPTSSPSLALLRFQWELLDDSGYRPELWQDVHTGTALPDGGSGYSFDPQGGGLTQRVGLEDWRVRRQTVDLLRQLATGEPIAPADGPTVERANRLLCAYLRALLDQELPTMPFVLRGSEGKAHV